jgi:O-antigen/teichoic acid export membrane protein
LALVLRNNIGAYLHLSDSGSVVAAAFTLSFALLLPTVRGVLQGTQDFVALAISTSTEGVAKIAFAVALAYAGFGVAGVFAGYALASAINLVYTLFAVRKHWGSAATRLAIDARRLLKTMGGVIIGTSAITLMGFVDVPLVKHFFSPMDAGIYGAISVCGKMLYFVVGFIPTLVLPKATHRAAHGSAPGAVLLQGLLMTFAFAAAGLALFFTVPGTIVKITYGAAFLPAAQYIFVYGVAMSLLAATNVIVTYKIGLHRYNFVLPVVAVAILEPVGIHLFHATLWQVIQVLLAGNALAFGLTLLRTPFGKAAS